MAQVFPVTTRMVVVGASKILILRVGLELTYIMLKKCYNHFKFGQLRNKMHCY